MIQSLTKPKQLKPFSLTRPHSPKPHLPTSSSSGFRPLTSDLRKAFTIVELLIVIVIIAILATITIIAYNGITQMAHETTIKSDLKTNNDALQIHYALHGSYPTTGNESALNDNRGLANSGDNTVTYTSDGTSYCLVATYGDITYSSTDTEQSPQEGECGEGGALTMQTFTKAMCNSLPVYDGTNEDDLRDLTDPRGNSPSEHQIYTIGKLADGNCWMLDNLKLGSTDGDLTLTPDYTDIDNNWTLPQATTSTSNGSYDIARVYGPVPGNTNSGATNYGYLYNWPAATAGETQTTKPAGSSNASHSICPKGWHLPSGTATGEFAMLNAKMNNPSATNPSTSNYYQNWHFSGPFRGVFSGLWWDGFSGQGDWGSFWSSSPHSGNADYAHGLSVNGSNVGPGDGYLDRGGGLGVRCLLN